MAPAHLRDRARSPPGPGPAPRRLDGPSAGLLYALADLDLLTPGRLAGSLRVAATGALGSDGVVTSVRMVDAKLAVARLARSDVFFAPAVPAGEVGVTVASHQGRPAAHGAIGDWLNTVGYELAGRAASAHAGEIALVPVDDVRQALAWLCGRTQQPETCAVAQRGRGRALRRRSPLRITVDRPSASLANVRPDRQPRPGPGTPAVRAVLGIRACTSSWRPSG